MALSNCILAVNFLKKVDKKPIKTSRFLWHVTYNTKSMNLFIAAYGLIRADNYAVFANNKLDCFGMMYPFCIDFHCDYTEYSFWRIDTSLLNVDWFIDPNMRNDLNILTGKAHNYVCSLQSIPNYALKLFHVNPFRLLHEEPFIRHNDGVVSISPYRNDLDALVPNKKINNYISWRSQNVPSVGKNNFIESILYKSTTLNNS